MSAISLNKYIFLPQKCSRTERSKGGLSPCTFMKTLQTNIYKLQEEQRAVFEDLT